MRNLLGSILDTIGWLFFLAGVIIAAFPITEFLTHHQAVATVIDVQPMCQREICTARKCRWHKIDCQMAPQIEAAGSKVRATPFARLAFVDTKGRERKAWSAYSNLEIEHADIGDRITVAYRGSSRPQAALPWRQDRFNIGLAITLFGVFLSMLARSLKREHAPARTQQSKPSKIRNAQKPNDTSSSTKPANRPQRVNSVQRQRRWFG